MSTPPVSAPPLPDTEVNPLPDSARFTPFVAAVRFDAFSNSQSPTLVRYAAAFAFVVASAEAAASIVNDLLILLNNSIFSSLRKLNIWAEYPLNLISDSQIIHCFINYLTGD